MVPWSSSAPATIDAVCDSSWPARSLTTASTSDHRVCVSSSTYGVWRAVRSQAGLPSVAVGLALGDTAWVNFLAHLVLSPQTPEGLIGSLAPDMIRGPLPDDLHPAVYASAKEHQSIDRFTDAHQAFSRTRERLGSIVSTRLAGVLADVLYDHVLARDWAQWRDDTLAAYLEPTEQGLLGALPHVPIRMQVIVRKMLDEQWLASYATTDGIRARLETMSQRLTRRLDRPMSLSISAADLADHAQALTEDFAQLWPDLLEHVDRFRSGSRGRLAS